MSNTYTVTVFPDISRHRVVYDGIGADVPLRILSEVVLRHIRDDGVVVTSERITELQTDDATVRSWPEFAPFEARLKQHLAEQMASVVPPQYLPVAPLVGH